MSLSRRLLLAGGVASLAARGVRASGGDFAPSAASLARPAAPMRSAAGLAITDAQGANVALADYAGKLLVVNLWAPWCLPCRREMPSLARLSERLSGQDALVLPLAFSWQGAVGVRRFYQETGIANLPVLIGDGDNLKATLGIEILPTTVVLDGDATHIATVTGEARWDDAATLDWLAGLI